jgi:hypothetical protein
MTKPIPPDVEGCESMFSAAVPTLPQTVQATRRFTALIVPPVLASSVPTRDSPEQLHDHLPSTLPSGEVNKFLLERAEFDSPPANTERGLGPVRKIEVPDPASVAPDVTSRLGRVTESPPANVPAQRAAQPRMLTFRTATAMIGSLAVALGVVAGPWATQRRDARDKRPERATQGPITTIVHSSMPGITAEPPKLIAPAVATLPPTDSAGPAERRSEPSRLSKGRHAGQTKSLAVTASPCLPCDRQKKRSAIYPDLPERTGNEP